KVFKQKKVTLSEDYPEKLISMSNLALALSDQGKYVEAEEMVRDTMESRKKVLSEKHLNTPMIIYWLLHFLRLQHQYKDALPLYERACDSYRASLGQNHPTFFNLFMQLCICSTTD
ncbi:hypothetical protein BS50DRAFT_493709, partial [Corynespora cassiicola Philippines]